MSSFDPLAGLDEQQKIVATSFDGPLCVLAGAGTGKTRALTHRIAYGIAEGKFLPESVLALTFTTKAAAEMGHRLRGLGVEGVATRTFHSAALRQLQHFWPEITGGYLPDIVASKGRIIAGALEGLKISLDTAVLRDIAGDIEWRKVQGYSLEEYREHRPARAGGLPGSLSLEVMLSIHERYESLKDEQSRIDFEDVLLACVGMLEEETRVRDRIQAQYGVFLVDEYQDVSPIQQRLLDAWLGKREDLVVVGDASQTIYTFAGASSSYLLDFATRYPTASVITLERNYRSSADIVQAANHVISGRPGAVVLRARDSPSTPIRRHIAASDQREADYIAQSIHNLLEQGRSGDDIAILTRFGAQSLLLETALASKGLSTRVQGAKDYFEQPHIQRAVMEIRGAAVAGVEGELATVVDDILHGIGFDGTPPDHAGAERSKYEDLLALRNLARSADPSTTVMEFSTMLTTRKSAGDSPSVGAITISTVHSAKGREWPVVFMMGLAEGLFPISYATTDAAIEEERRLFYVGITRAREELVLSMGERSKETSPLRELSRFVSGLSVSR
ncbi:MAG: ATP-dependent helicase [Microbacteriaceae bacterium]|nr:ATP-dependent helicase [Microbacteriaceae bacterium]MBT7803111.1 ATP-dependent helicase [Microbacteriaceae bacterium]